LAASGGQSAPARPAGPSGSGALQSSLQGSGNLTPASALAGQSPPAASAQPMASPDARSIALAHTRVVSGFVAASSSGQPSGTTSLPSQLQAVTSVGLPVTSMSSNSTAASQSVNAGVTDSSSFLPGSGGQKAGGYVRSASEGAGLDSMSRARVAGPGNVRASADILSTAGSMHAPVGSTSPLTVMQVRHFAMCVGLGLLHAFLLCCWYWILWAYMCWSCHQSMS
jgi:hypothetical protein